MRGLSILQPWAALVASGAKRIETRSWRTRYQGPVVIYAGKRFSDRQADLARSPEIYPLLMEFCRASDWGLRFGGPIAVVDLESCREIIGGEGPPRMVDWGDITVPVPESEVPLGDYEDGRFAWRLSNPRRLDPDAFAGLDVRGRQGLFNPPAEVLAVVRAQLAAAEGGLR